MRIIAADEIDRALDFPELIDALRDAFAAGWRAPARAHHEIARDGGASATLLLMPAWTDDAPGAGFVGTKIVSVFPANAGIGEPSVLGAYLLLDGRSGRPLAVLDGARLTLWRTAAASALAASFLAREDANRMVMVGAGALAPFLVRAHRSRRPIRELLIWNRSPGRAERLAASLSEEGIDAKAALDLEPAVRQADLVSCATLAEEPLVRGEWLSPGAHLDLVGAFNLGMREADDTALQRAEIFVDTEAACTEGGDLALALASGAIGRGHVRGTLADLCRGVHGGRADPDQITLFKSVGTALEDLAVAILVWRRCCG